ncbi:hypothetical protein O181_123793 [Austropuccinia psidii MF-1]|uniref:Reverse transcriptase/retrotransposon-derived protein RNase H-like domain-containing protein n=1 Tax=Austropuccinia psidii MF-1 TaxID=1389203 RepID=A0A9Q3KME3_9BASI|nr:hypothetical protein [Austropuccinia psidii MF-1]
MLFLLKASKWTKQRSSRFSTGLLQETSRLFNHSLALPISTAVSSRIIQGRSVHSPVSSRNIPVSLSMRKPSVSFTNSKRRSPPPQPFLPTIVETDASDYALGAVLSQVSDSGKHPIAFNSCNLSSPFEALTNPSSLQKFSLAFKPAGLNSFLNSIFQSLTALAS